jgi:hypothetical protein
LLSGRTEYGGLPLKVEDVTAAGSWVAAVVSGAELEDAVGAVKGCFVDGGFIWSMVSSGGICSVDCEGTLPLFGGGPSAQTKEY